MPFRVIHAGILEHKITRQNINRTTTETINSARNTNVADYFIRTGCTCLSKPILSITICTTALSTKSCNEVKIPVLKRTKRTKYHTPEKQVNIKIVIMLRQKFYRKRFRKLECEIQIKNAKNTLRQLLKAKELALQGASKPVSQHFEEGQYDKN